MTIGERGKTGDHGQAGDPGAPGSAGPQGEKGDPGINPWVVRRANLAYGVLFLGMLLTVATFWNNARNADERLDDVDKAFCMLANENRIELNANRDAIRTLTTAVRKSYELVQPSISATPADRERVLEFRRQILAQLDAVQIGANLTLLNCVVADQLDTSILTTTSAP